MSRNERGMNFGFLISCRRQQGSRPYFLSQRLGPKMAQRAQSCGGPTVFTECWEEEGGNAATAVHTCDGQKREEREGVEEGHWL